MSICIYIYITIVSPSGALWTLRWFLWEIRGPGCRLGCGTDVKAAGERRRFGLNGRIHLVSWLSVHLFKPSPWLRGKPTTSVPPPHFDTETIHSRKTMCHVPLLMLMGIGIYHYWTYVLIFGRGQKAHGAKPAMFSALGTFNMEEALGFTQNQSQVTRSSFILLKTILCFPLVGLKGNLSLLDICFLFSPGSLSKWKSWKPLFSGWIRLGSTQRRKKQKNRDAPSPQAAAEYADPRRLMADFYRTGARGPRWEELGASPT